MKVSFPFTKEYSDEEKSSILQMLSEAYSVLPLSISQPLKSFEDFLEKNEYLKAMICMLDFFELSSQFLSAVFIVMMKDKNLLNDKDLEKVVNVIDTKRSLSFGDWVNEILPVVAKKANQSMPDLNLAKTVCDKMFPKKSNVFTNWGNEPSIVAIRNNYKGHGSLLADEIYKNVISSAEKRVWIVLEALMPLKEFSFFAFTKDFKPESQNIDTETLQDCHYYLYHRDSCKIYDIYPLIVSDNQGFVYVFQTLKDENIYLISADEKAPPLTTMDYNDSFDEIFKCFVPSFDINKEKNWDEILQLVTKETKSFLTKIYKEKKYNKELFVDRKVLSNYFKDFIDSDKVLFPLLGEAGQGKTNQLCFWGENLIKDGHAAFLFNSNSFSNITFEDKLRNIFSFNKRKPIEKLLNNIHAKAEENGEFIYFIFDALNECLNYKDSENIGEGALDLYHDIRKLLVNSCYPRFKVLFTIRSYTWKTLIQKEVKKNDPLVFSIGEGKEVSINGFTDEELVMAYKSYSKYFQTLTTIDELTSKEYRLVFIRLKDPLILKIACTNYMQKQLPTDISSFSSVNLFEMIMNDLIHNYAGNIQRDILNDFAAFLLEEYCKGNPKDNVYISDLKKAYKNPESPLYNIASNLLTDEGEGVSIAYGELLSKPGKPILRLIETDELSSSDSEQIQFIYERFLEYMLAKAFMKKEKTRCKEGATIDAERYIEELNLTGSNVVMMGAMRNALIMDYLENDNADTIIELVKNKKDSYEVMLLVTDLLNVMVREDYENKLNKLLSAIIAEGKDEIKPLVEQFKSLTNTIEKGSGSEDLVKEQRDCMNRIEPVAKMREIASMTMNGIFQTDFFNEDLYMEPDRLYSHLWFLLLDPIDKVRNNISLYIYYLSRVHETSGYSPTNGNIADKIITEIFKKINSYSFGSILFSGTKRKEAIELIEAGGRIGLVLIIDSLVLENPSNYDRTRFLKHQIEMAFRHFTGNFKLVKVVMPLLKTVLRRQLTVQANYVNNSVEYQRFWNDECILGQSSDEQHWGRNQYKMLAPFLRDCYRKQYGEKTEAGLIQDFTKYQPAILDAYSKGDSFSYFLLERVLIIQGLCDWNLIRPIVTRFFAEYRDNPLFDYSQMSMLYVLFQILIKKNDAPDEIRVIFDRECDDWQRRCKGVYNAHSNYYANHGNPYKQYIMNWYCVAYCSKYGDGNKKESDERAVPLFYKIIKDAYDNKDKESFFNCIENISVLVSDFGYWRTALDLLKYTFDLITEQSQIDEIDSIVLPSRENYNVPLTTYFGKVLGTVKNYFPKEVDLFVKKELANSKFPGIEKYREEILNYNPSGESIGDLLTHKFGNFIVWGLMNDNNIGQFAEEAYTLGSNSKDYFDWFDAVIRLTFWHVFKVKL